ncbi:hypothetical protein HanIR_Chr14g0722501 [Helianthus annuus]|nr:hypothetical protein HanIR_Chr14g0722501 [Helianthus annuus]
MAYYISIYTNRLAKVSTPRFSLKKTAQIFIDPRHVICEQKNTTTLTPQMAYISVYTNRLARNNTPRFSLKKTAQIFINLRGCLATSEWLSAEPVRDMNH